jgi:hypothetical protein
MSAQIWKPGTEKPKEKEAERPSAPLRTKSLSGITRNMRFMQRNNQDDRRKSTGDTHANPRNGLLPPQSQQDTNYIDDSAAPSSSVTAPVTATASNEDIYGAQINVLGRRSFGGFNTIIQQAWQASITNESSSCKKRIRSDEELVNNYEALIRDRKKNRKNVRK